LTYGEDYTSVPNISLRVQDIVISNVDTQNMPKNGDIIYQGGSVNTAIYSAVVYSIQELEYNDIQEQSLYNIRVYNYTSTVTQNIPLKILDKTFHLTLAPPTEEINGVVSYRLGRFFNSTLYDINGTITYGNGKAKATSKFLNGLVIGSGQYLINKGQPSGFSVLQSKVYNNYTYQITVEKEISKYRSVLLNLLHPLGMQVLGRYAIKANSSTIIDSQDAVDVAHSLYYYTGREQSNVSMNIIAPTKSTNIIKFNNIGTANISSFISPNSTIQFKTSYGDIINSKITSINSSANTITVDSNVWLVFANVATATAVSGSNNINVNSLTGKYDIINNGKYTNANSPLMDIVRTGDSLSIQNNTSKIVSSVDYINNIIYLTTNITGNTNKSLIAVNRTLTASSIAVKIYGPRTS